MAVTIDYTNTIYNYRDLNRIYFHHADNLTEVIHSYSVEPHLPGELCTSGNTMLMYLDKSKNPREVRWLDCRGPTPRPLKSITTMHSHVSEMCYAKMDNKDLLAAANGYGIYAYNTNTGELDWSVSGEVKGMKEEIYPDGVTSDGQGHLFLSDARRASIHVFSTDGEYIVRLIKAGEQGFGVPGCIRWCVNTLSLIATHFRDNTWFISFIKLLDQKV